VKKPTESNTNKPIPKKDGSDATRTEKKSFKSWLLELRLHIHSHLTEFVILLGFLVIIVGLNAILKGTLFEEFKDLWAHLFHSHTSSMKIAVFYPDPTRDGAAYKDGKIQKEGFDAAFEQARQKSGQSIREPKWEPYLFRQENGGRRVGEFLLERMKSLYAEGYRIFILTMSSAAKDTTPDFKIWRDEHQDDPPILILTVASAPDIANKEKGIFRLYVRSKEEAEEVARYAAWKTGLKNLAVFYIQDSPNQPNDYGMGGFITVKHEFEELAGHVNPYPVLADGSNAAVEVRAFLEARNKNERTGVFVVGYDTMLNSTVSQLINQHFDGPIMCASTLTQPEWQPRDHSLDAQIITLEPHHDAPKLDVEKGVVYQFAHLTLSVALDCASRNVSSEGFSKCWEGFTDGGQIEHLSDGDAVVPMHITTTWRITKVDESQLTGN
jgi:hypothetical protein